jgi:hypothetical protein
MRAKGLLPPGEFKKETREENLAKKRQAEIENSIKHCDFSKPNYLQQSDKSIYYYEKEQAISTLN